jgi:signal peptidase II
MRTLQENRLTVKIIALVSTLLVSVGLDQLTKWLAVTYLKPIRSYPLWENVFHFTYVQNRGAAFGMLADHRFVFLILSTIGILAILFYLFWDRELDLFSFISLACVAGGGIGNMIDRVAYGYVVDFLDFTLIDFAVFNVADSFVCCGVVLFVIAFVRNLIKEQKTKKEE